MSGKRAIRDGGRPSEGGSCPNKSARRLAVPPRRLRFDEAEGPRHLTLLATGSEVEIALAARSLLAEQGVQAAVVSMPCLEVFDAQPQEYRAGVLGSALRYAIEAGSSYGWSRYVGAAGPEHLGLIASGLGAGRAALRRVWPHAAGHRRGSSGRPEHHDRLTARRRGRPTISGSERQAPAPSRRVTLERPLASRGAIRASGNKGSGQTRLRLIRAVHRRARGRDCVNDDTDVAIIVHETVEIGLPQH